MQSWAPCVPVHNTCFALATVMLYFMDTPHIFDTDLDAMLFHATHPGADRLLVRSTHVGAGDVLVDVEPADDGSFDMHVNDVRLTSVDDMRALLPLSCTTRIHVHNGSLITLLVMNQAERHELPQQRPVWVRVSRLLEEALRLRDTPGALTYESAKSYWHGVRHLVTLAPEFGNELLPPSLTEDAVIACLPDDAIMEYGVALALSELLLSDVRVVGIGNAHLPDFSRAGIAVLTTMRDLAGVIPTYILEGVPGRATTLPTLGFWADADTAKIGLHTHLARAPVSPVTAAGTLLHPDIAAWYRSFHMHTGPAWLHLDETADAPPTKHVLFNSSVVNWNSQGGFPLFRHLGVTGDHTNCIFGTTAQQPPDGAPLTQSLQYTVAATHKP